jgi:hypothetical protein
MNLRGELRRLLQLELLVVGESSPLGVFGPTGGAGSGTGSLDVAGAGIGSASLSGRIRRL